MPDKDYELAIVDPPYGIDRKISTSSNLNAGNAFAIKYNEKRWDRERPGSGYFSELFRVSCNQIICGANYFSAYLPASRGWAILDKQGKGMSSVNDELIFTSFDVSIKTFSRCHGLDKGFMNAEGGNIHPTQKPVRLYEWLLTNYAKPGDRILDTHGGSGSICIACHDLGFDLDWYELDTDYYRGAMERVKRHQMQQVIPFAEESIKCQAAFL